jgi:serine/threonine protein kinase
MPALSSSQTFLNQYHVEEFVALTPLGELYRATDTRTNKPLALTLLPKTVYENAEAIKNLDAESAKLRGIAHPNLVPYLGLYQTPTLAFLLEEWIDGPSLTEVLGKAPLTINEILIYIKAICSALEALHKHNYLHLNLAPELIHINNHGEIFLGGIGTARQMSKKADQDRQGKYPRLYFSPEQFNRQPLTPASDTYALTILIYELATGAWINGKSAPKTDDAIRKTHLESTPPAPISLNKEIPDHFSRMIVWALRKKPEDRLKTTTELLSSLARVFLWMKFRFALRRQLLQLHQRFLANGIFCRRPNQISLPRTCHLLKTAWQRSEMCSRKKAGCASASCQFLYLCWSQALYPCFGLCALRLFQSPLRCNLLPLHQITHRHRHASRPRFQDPLTQMADASPSPALAETTTNCA